MARLPEPPPRQHLGHRVASSIQSHWTTRFLAALGIWLVILTGIGIYWEYSSRAEERAARLEEAKFRRLAQIATAWEILLTPVGGDTGKGNALNTLITAGITITGADFSCKAVGTWRDGECINPPIFNDVVLGDGDFWQDDEAHRVSCDFCDPRNVYVKNSRFDGAILNNLRAEHFDLAQGLQNVKGADWTIRNVVYWAGDPRSDSSDGFECENCRFFSGFMPWDFFTRLNDPVLGDIRIRVPFERKDPILESLAARDGGFGNPPVDDWNLASFPIATTYVDAPVLLYWENDFTIVDATSAAPLPNFTWADDIGDSAQPVGDPEGAIFWPVYEKLNYCLNNKDWEALRPTREQRFQQASAEFEAAQDQRTPEENGIAPVILLVPEPEQTFEPNQIGWVDGQTNDPSRGPVAYACGYDWQDVEPLLRPRLIEMVSQLGPN